MTFLLLHFAKLKILHITPHIITPNFRNFLLSKPEILNIGECSNGYIIVFQSVYAKF